MIAWRRWHFRGRVFKSRHPTKRLWCLKVQHPFEWRNGFQAGGLSSVSRSPFRHIPHGAAIEVLMLVADRGGPTMFARLRVMRALNRHVERVFYPFAQGKALGPAQTRARSIRQEAVGHVA